MTVAQTGIILCKLSEGNSQFFATRCDLDHSRFLACRVISKM
jgi:hypothetical protein